MKSCRAKRAHNFFSIVVSCSSYGKDKKRDGKDGISTDHWALSRLCSSWRAKQTAFMSLFCSDSLTPLVPKSTTNIAFLANLQPSPFVHYISFDLHPSHLQRLQTPPDRDWPFLGVVWYLAKVNSTSDHPFQYTYRHHAERPRPPKDGSRLLVNRGKDKFSHLQSESNLWEHSVSSSLHQAVSSSSLPLACHNFQSFPVCKAMNFAKAQTRAVFNGCDKTVITVEYFLSLLLWEDKFLTSVWNSGALLMCVVAEWIVAQEVVLSSQRQHQAYCLKTLVFLLQHFQQTRLLCLLLWVNQ